MNLSGDLLECGEERFALVVHCRGERGEIRVTYNLCHVVSLIVRGAVHGRTQKPR